MSLPPHKHYDTPGAALQSKAFLTTEGAQVVPCGCGKFRVLRPAPPRTTLMRKSSPKGRRDTGPDRKTRAAVIAREGGCCAACGMNVTGRAWSIQHRVARGMGGTSRPGANAMTNLVLLCGSSTSPGGCHLACERRDPDMHGRGFWLESWEDPAAIPVMLASPHGSGITVWLSDSGTYSTEPPSGVAAL